MKRSALLAAAAAALLSAAPARAQDPKVRPSERQVKVTLGVLPATGPGHLPAILELFDNGEQRFVYVRDKGRSALQDGDVILGLGGRIVKDLEAVGQRCRERRAGDSLLVSLIRGVKPTTVELRLAPIPGPAHLGLTTSTRQGFLSIESVEKDGAAARAGLRPGDVLLGLGDRRLAKPEELAAVIQKKQAFERVSLSYLREGKLARAEVELLEKPRRGYIGIQQQVENGASRITRIMPGTAAEKVGLEVGETIVAFDGRPLTPARPLLSMLEETRPGQEVTLTLRKP